MKLVWTRRAHRDLVEILAFIQAEFPAAHAPFQRQLRLTEKRIAQWPDSARRVEGMPDIRVVPMVRYPYRIAYRVTQDAVEILHIHHTARRDP